MFAFKPSPSLPLLSNPQASWARPAPADDRRECPRVLLDRIALHANGVSLLGRGDLSVGGALWIGKAAQPIEDALEVTFQLSPAAEALRLRVAVVHRHEREGLTALHLRFVDPPFEAERRIARHVDDVMSLLRR